MAIQGLKDQVLLKTPSFRELKLDRKEVMKSRNRNSSPHIQCQKAGNRMNSTGYFIGIDIASETFDATLYTVAAQAYSKARHFDNTVDGFEVFDDWLTHQGIEPAQALVCMEATGVYAEALCYWLIAKGYHVAVEAPHKVKRAFHPLGAKSDPVDSRQIAEYAHRFWDQLALWQAPEALLEQVKTLLSTREQLTGQSTASQNALQALERKVVRTYLAEETLRSTLVHLKEQIRKIDEALKNLLRNHPTLNAGVTLLLTIPSVGWLLAAHWAVMSQGFQKVLEPRQVAAHLGICPLEHTSGTSLKFRALSRHVGPPTMRKLVHLAARTLRVHHSDFKAYFLRKVEGGKPKTLVLNNIANRLLRIICAVIRTKTPYIVGYKSVNPMLVKIA
jgi:transposase